ncbi:MAG: TadE/TadG family type IV pilus assembly protein [Acidimicrobiia bacterium]
MRHLVHRFRQAESGVAMVWLATKLVLLLGTAGFAVDLGWLYLSTSRTQRSEVGAMRSERGTTLVEFSFVFMLMMMLAIGSFEWGMGFRDRLAVAQSVREGARVGAALRDHSLSD